MFQKQIPIPSTILILFIIVIIVLIAIYLLFHKIWIYQNSTIANIIRSILNYIITKEMKYYTQKVIW